MKHFKNTLANFQTFDKTIKIKFEMMDVSALLKRLKPI